MKIYRIFVTLVIVFVVISSSLTYAGFSFAATSSNGTPSQSIATSSSSTSTLPSSTGGPYPCSNTDKYLWDHTYGKTGKAGEIRLKDSGQCITMTGTVYSSSGGTNEEPDGDLHFTLQLDPQYEQYWNKYDPSCKPYHSTDPPCKNIIVEVICHNKIDPSYINKFGPYCNGVNSILQGEPHQGDKLLVSGRWVTDLDETVVPPEKPHAPWNEIHPPSYIKKLS